MIDTGNTAFMILCTSLVMLMTPGLAFFYGGLVGRKNVLTIMIQSYVSMGVTTVIWYFFGYSLCFSGDVGGVIGNFHNAFLMHLSAGDIFSSRIPLYTYIAYEMMFAIITPALITGAFANRVRFRAYLIFLVVWLAFVYFPMVHMIWGGGMLQKWGVLDFAGGTVVHAIAGMAALASVFFVGRREVRDRGPHSIPLVALGTGLLWFGWYGFNAGSELRIDAVTATAFLNTDIAASFAAVVWLVLAWSFEHKPKFLGLLTGAVAGLATITPAAGYVTPTSAVIIGIVSGSRMLLRRGSQESLEMGRRSRRVGGARSGRRPRYGDARSAGHDRGESGRRERPRPRPWDLLPQGTSHRRGGKRLGFRLHVRRAEAHQPSDAGESEPGRRRRGPGRNSSTASMPTSWMPTRCDTWGCLLPSERLS